MDHLSSTCRFGRVRAEGPITFDYFILKKLKVNYISTFVLIAQIKHKFS